jgi:imidazoleglycerol-phosphate dehydratase
MAATGATGQGRANTRVNVSGRGQTNVGTGVPVLDHLLTLLATYASFDLSLDVEPGSAEVEIAVAARSLGEALHEPLRADDARGHGSAVVPVDEALAHVALEASGRPLLVSNVDLSEARIAGLAGDLGARFLDELAQSAGLTLHVRLLEGSDTQHVLEAIFKALGVALAQACRPRGRTGE